MSRLWFVSDTHFNQPSILKFLKPDGTRLREFSSVEEMNERMIDEWNSVVRDGDCVVHLGDVFYGGRDYYAKHIHPRLKGRKSVVLGNHDKGKEMVGLFHSVSSERRYSEHGFVASHRPMHRETCYNWRRKEYMVNVHGHTHAMDMPDRGYVNVCVEKTGYRPISLDEVIEKVKQAI